MSDYISNIDQSQLLAYPLLRDMQRWSGDLLRAEMSTTAASETSHGTLLTMLKLNRMQKNVNMLVRTS